MQRKRKRDQQVRLLCNQKRFLFRQQVRKNSDDIFLVYVCKERLEVAEVHVRQFIDLWYLYNQRLCNFNWVLYFGFIPDRAGNLKDDVEKILFQQSRVRLIDFCMQISQNLVEIIEVRVNASDCNCFWQPDLLFALLWDAAQLVEFALNPELWILLFRRLRF